MHSYFFFVQLVLISYFQQVLYHYFQNARLTSISSQQYTASNLKTQLIYVCKASFNIVIMCITAVMSNNNFTSSSSSMTSNAEATLYLYLNHALSAPAIKPLHTTFFKEGWIAFTVDGKCWISTVHDQNNMQIDGDS